MAGLHCSLGLLMRRVSVGSVETMVTDLGTKLTAAGKKEDQREIAGIGLKTAVQELPRGPAAKAAVKKLTPPLIAGISNKVPHIMMPYACSRLMVAVDNTTNCHPNMAMASHHCFFSCPTAETFLPSIGRTSSAMRCKPCLIIMRFHIHCQSLQASSNSHGA